MEEGKDYIELSIDTLAGRALAWKSQRIRFHVIYPGDDLDPYGYSGRFLEKRRQKPVIRAFRDGAAHMRAWAPVSGAGWTLAAIIRHPPDQGLVIEPSVYGLRADEFKKLWDWAITVPEKPCSPK